MNPLSTLDRHYYYIQTLTDLNIHDAGLQHPKREVLKYDVVLFEAVVSELPAAEVLRHEGAQFQEILVCCGRESLVEVHFTLLSLFYYWLEDGTVVALKKTLSGMEWAILIIFFF